MKSGLVAVLLVLAGLVAGCSPERGARADPERTVFAAVAGPAPAPPGTEPKGGDSVPLPPTPEAEEAERAAARARLPTRCVEIRCPALEARWSAEVAPCVQKAAAEYRAADCYGDAAWRLDRVLERQFRHAVATTDPGTARRVSRLHAEWRKGLKACRIDVGRGPESQIDENLCLYSFSIERQIALERLAGNQAKAGADNSPRSLP